MSAVDAGGKAKAPKTRAEKKAKAAQVEQPPADKLKIVVRRLPPNIPEDIFWQSVQLWVAEETVSWRVFYPGKIRKKRNVNKENIPSRAYIAFRNVEQVAAFSQAYDGHRFQDKSGNESVAVVEFAPFQKVPPERKKVDPRAGTIEQDEDYISFVASLNAPPPKPSESDTIEALIAASRPPPEPETTPLLEALRADKLAQRDRDTILKAHAHYQRGDPDVLVSGSSRRRGGKGAAAPAADDGASVSGASQGKRRRGRKGDVKEKGKEREQPNVKGTPKIVQKAAGAHAPTIAKEKEREKDIPKDKEAPKGKGARVALSPGGARSLQMALSGVGIRRGEKKSTAVTPASGSNATLAVPSANTTPQQPEAAKEKAKDKPDQAPTQAPSSPGRERGRGGRRRGDSAKSPSRAANQPQAQAQGQGRGGAPGAAPTILARPAVVQRQAENTPSPAPASTPTDSAKPGQGNAEGGGRGGRRRGRGRGGGPGSGNSARGGAPASVAAGAGATPA